MTTDCTPQVGFDCPGCGDTTVIETEDPESLENSIFRCDGCGENVLLDNYVGDRDE